METDVAKYSNRDLEDGELSDSDGGYTPLQRPDTKSQQAVDQSMAISTSALKMDDVEDNPFESDFSSVESSSGSDEGVKALTRDLSKQSKSKKKRPTVQLPVKSIETFQQARSKKYNIWTESLQEESLMENMRGFDVAKDSKCDRSVETYDFNLKYRLNGENRLKRRLSNADVVYSDNGYYHNNKRCRTDVRSVKDRLGRRSSGSSSGSQCTPRHILDLVVGIDNDREDVARDIAKKLYEERDDLLMRVVEILGNELSIEVFKKTQRIEKDGGMMIMNGRRRRTPGGVFLFLLKRDDGISAEDKKAIFHEDVKKSSRDRKIIQACRRDQKVEELKKHLNIKEKELKPFVNRSDIIKTMTHIKSNTNGALSNPPPSPVTNGGLESSPDYSSHAINHVNDHIPEKAIPQNIQDLEDDNDSLTAYDDDFLDMNCDDIDMF